MNRPRPAGVWPTKAGEVLLDDVIDLAPGRAVTAEPALEREFEARLEDTSTLAFRVALSVLRRREEAEDVAQEAFLRAHRAFRSLRDRERFRAWMVRMAFRLALDRQRSARRRLRQEEAAATERVSLSQSAEDEMARQQIRERVGEAVGGLPDKLRIVVVLAAIEEHDLGEVARLLGLPEGTVKSRLHRARRILGEKLRWLANDIVKR